jgi:hypothetical protein
VVNEALRLDDEPEFPEIEIPEPDVGEPGGLPLVSSRWSFAEQTRALIARKNYE